MDVVVIVGSLILFPIAFFAIVKTIYHWWFVVTGVRRDKVITASVFGLFLFLIPSWFKGVFDETAQEHLRRLNPWLLVSAVSLLLLFGLRALGEHLG